MTYRLVKAKLETAAKEAPTGPFRMVVGYRAKNSQDEPDDQVLRLAQSTAKSKGKSLGTHSAYGTNYEYELGDNLSEAVAKAKALSASIVDHNKRVAPDLRIKTSKYFILVMDSFGSQVYPKKTTMSGVETAADAGDKWWKSLDKKQQDAYLKLHPNSKYGKKKGKAPAAPGKVGTGLTRPKVATKDMEGVWRTAIPGKPRKPNPAAQARHEEKINKLKAKIKEATAKANSLRSLKRPMDDDAHWNRVDKIEWALNGLKSQLLELQSYNYK